MPSDTLGFRLSGKLTRDEYFQILDPVREKLERGEKVSFLVETAAGFHGLDMGALARTTLPQSAGAAPAEATLTPRSRKSPSSSP